MSILMVDALETRTGDTAAAPGELKKNQKILEDDIFVSPGLQEYLQNNTFASFKLTPASKLCDDENLMLSSPELGKAIAFWLQL